MSLQLADRFWAKVKKGNGCWLWTAARGTNGYGLFWRGRGGPPGGMQTAHRAAYELTHGTIAPGLTVDHLCSNRLCVNPNHLELTTRGENTLRGKTITAAHAAKTECIHGHRFDSRNTYLRPNGGRSCRTCRREILRRWRLKRVIGA